jgi:hypothetical protein
MRSHRSTPLRPVRFARLSCEILEGRLVLSAGLLGALSDAATGLVHPGQYSLLVTDLTGEGENDIVSASEDSNSVSVDLDGPKPAATAIVHATAAIMPPKDIQFTIPTPSAVALGDLTGNGIDDMIVCDKSEDRVFIYLGLGGGRFGPELNRGAGLITGVNPDAVAMMPAPDGTGTEVVVANAGSNDVAIFQVHETPDGCNLVLKGRAHVGLNPSSVLVQDLNGQGTPDLVVTNAGDNTVSILPGTPEGLFDDRAARILHTGDRPVQALVGNFDGREDLVTVNSGSNDVTFFSDVTSPATVGRRISTGGMQPIAALAQDVTGTGRSDLIVANYGDSRLTLLTGTASGLKLSESLQENGLHPAALAAGSGMPAGSFYVLNAEQPTPTVMQFDVPQTIPTSLTPAPTEGERTAATSGPQREEETARSTDWLVPGRAVGTDLQPLTPSSVAVVPGVALRTDVSHPVTGSPCPPGGCAEDSTTLAPVPPPVPITPVSALAGDEPPSVQRFILGTDQEPPPRIGPEGSSMTQSEREPVPDLRPAALPVVLASPSPPIPESPEPAASAVAAGESSVPELAAGAEVYQPGKVLVVLAAAGLMLRWREEVRPRLTLSCGTRPGQRSSWRVPSRSRGARSRPPEAGRSC